MWRYWVVTIRVLDTETVFKIRAATARIALTVALEKYSSDISNVSTLTVKVKEVLK